MWEPRRKQREWNREWKDAPLSQLRGMLDRGAFWQDKEKERWARRKLWWHDHRGWVFTTVIAVLALLVGALNLLLKCAR
jgi:hypothetical protein